MSDLLHALEARLASVEEAIVRLTTQASQDKDFDRQQQYWTLAQDLQREAREIRRQISVQSQPEHDPSDKADDQSKSQIRERKDWISRSYFTLGGAAAGFLSVNCR